MMENIHSITERIKSRIACNETHCPIIRERLDQHVMSYHSSLRSTVSRPRISTQEKSVGTFASSSNPILVINLDEHTSTTDLRTDVIDNAKSIPNYRQALEIEIHKWAEHLPKYSNSRAENLKQYMVNELIENINHLYPEIFEDFYDLKLSMELNQFLNSLPTASGTWTHENGNIETLKQDIFNKVHELNNEIINGKGADNYKNKTDKSEDPKIKNYATNTILSPDDTGQSTKAYPNESVTMTSYLSDDYSTSNQSGTVNNNFNGKQFVDAQIQPHSSNITSYCGSISGQPNLKIQQYNSREVDLLKQSVFNFLSQIILYNKFIQLSDMYVLTDVLTNRLKPLLKQKEYSTKFKLLLKEEILNFFSDYFSDSVTFNSAHCSKLIDDLINSLINDADAQLLPRIYNTYMQRSYNCADQFIRLNKEPEHYFKSIFLTAVANNLEHIIHADAIENDISELIYNNIKKIRMSNYETLKSDLFTLLKISTNLADCSVEDIINAILTEIKYIVFKNINDDNSIKKSFNNSYWSNIFYVYKSEHDLGNPCDHCTIVS